MLHRSPSASAGHQHPTGIRAFTVLFLFLLFLSSANVQATHMAGADLTYESLGNGEYLFTYTFYRDCIGIPAPADATLEITSASCGYNGAITLLPVPGTGQEITYACPGAFTTCQGGSDPGIQEWEYTGTFTLPMQCSDWHFGVAQCCRNAAITTIVNPLGYDLYIEATLNNLTGENNSPFFSNVPIAFECIGQDNYFNHGLIDVDGDSLVYLFTNPLNALNDPLTYVSGYSIVNPITSSPAVSINSTNGDIFMHPTQPEVGVVAVQIQEWRNGVLVGYVTRDIQIYTVQCNNQLPTATGINGTAVFDTTICVGGQLCFNVFSDDQDAGDIVSMSWNNGISAATFDTAGVPHPTGLFCWTPTPADVRPQPYTFTVTVHDDACPSNGVQSYAYSVTVSQMNVSVTSTPSVSCYGSHNGFATATASGIGPFEYLWMPGELTGPSLSHLSAGTYSVDVVSAYGCHNTQTFTITEPPELTVDASGTNASCNGTPGSASALVSGGTPSYTYVWNTSPVQTTAAITGLSAGTYVVTVHDDHNCVASDTVSISGGSGFTALITSTPATCNANDGTAAVTVSGGSGPFDYSWDPNVSNGPSATGLTSGVYEVTITDQSSGCVQVVTTIVGNSSGIVASIDSSADATCQDGDDGFASASGSGGTAPYTYLWSPTGDTSATVSHLSPGVHTVAVSDYNGCTGYASVTIGYLNPSPVIDLGPDTIACDGTTYTLDAGSGHTDYLWSDNSTGQTLDVTAAGTYSVLVTDASGCQSFDAVNVDFITCQGPHPATARGNSSRHLNVYPNPVSGELQIHWNLREKSDLVIELFDPLGNLVLHKTLSKVRQLETSIDMSGLSPGVYTIHVQSDMQSEVLPVVKQ